MSDATAANEQHHLLSEAQRYKAVLDHLHTLVFEWDGEGKMVYTSPLISRFLSGKYDDRAVLRVWAEDNVVFGADRHTFEAFMEAVAAGEPEGDMTIRLRRKDGHAGWYAVSFSSFEDKDHGTRFIGTVHDVDEVTRNLEKLRYRAEYDDLTGCYNRSSFIEKATAELENNAGEDHFIMRFDVANFKYLNEVIGMEQGDELLLELARQARALLVRPHEFLSRLSGDMFAVCLMGDMDRVKDFIRKVSDGIRNFNTTPNISLYFGVCPVTDFSTPVHVLGARALEALKTVKGSDLTNYAVYNNPLRDRLLEENRIVEQMHTALAAGEFIPYLQPKVAMHTGKIVGAEALVRWIHPQEGMLSPGVFIPLFERNGFIVRLDEYIWEATCKLLRSWLDKGYSPAPISVNVSRVHFLDPGFGKKIIDLTDKYNVPRHLLELEITESAFFGSERTLVRVMQSLQEAGFHFSMDDFGTGYSSLGTLRTLPFNIIKLDRAFISDGTDNPRGQVVARHTVAMARELDMRLVAEGIETEEQANFLLSIGCIVAQGYFYCKPIDPMEFEVLAYMQDQSFGVPPLLQETARKMGPMLALQGMPLDAAEGSHD